MSDEFDEDVRRFVSVGAPWWFVVAMIAGVLLLLGARERDPGAINGETLNPYEAN